MQIQLFIQRNTSFGHAIQVSINKELIPMEYKDGYWTIETTSIENGYYYYVETSSSEIIRTETFPHLFPSFSNNQIKVEMRDQWNDSFEPYSPQFFQEIVYSRKQEERPSPLSQAVVILRCKWQSVPSGYSIYVTGSNSEFGKWDTYKALQMKAVGMSWWELAIPIENIREAFEYKYFMKKTEVVWEDGPNRLFAPMLGSFIGCKRAVIYQEDIVKFIGSYKAAGIKVCISGINGKGIGCGDINDLYDIIKFCEKSGLSIIEILPVNDYSDVYYTPSSLNALDPMILSLKDFKITKEIQEVIEGAKRELNYEKWIDRKRVLYWKNKIFHLIFNLEKEQYKTVTSVLFEKQKGENDLEIFVEKNRKWLLPYIVYKCCGMNGVPTMENLKKLLLNNTEECVFNIFIQFNLFKQMKEIYKYAKEKHIGLIGTLPFSVSHDSVDAWINSNYFYVNKEIVDIMNRKKYYGIPYNWNELENNEYSLFKERIELMKTLFPIIKFDSISFFFRTWEVEENGTYGCYCPQNGYTKQDLNYRGINDLDRLTYCYIRDHTLTSLFGEDKDYVIDNFLVDNKDGSYNLSASFRNESQIRNESGLKEKRASDRKIIEGLIKLLNNVILYQVGDKYIPSPYIKDTYSSYDELEPSIQENINKLFEEFYERRNYQLWKQQGKRVLSSFCDSQTIYIGQCERAFYEELNNLKIITNDFLSINSLIESSETQTLRAYWEYNRNQLWNQLRKGGNPPQFCTTQIMNELITMKMNLPSMFVIFNIQDIIGLRDYYIVNKNPHLESWVIDDKLKYKLSVTTDELNGDYDLQNTISHLITITGRNMN
ncbi:hypothetical protein EDI_127280 [Entamoeba dispar SAW760]|uniref:4-alpha-glucanotransferase n=1 Tax=Entamoeba dispar (strain ATCC PRA-260 / SAW760) TaxID=370354 RepID=B0E8I1_ENTDS|nr:uncharacterized protein EDI_127280 [Entamoeba dispar SAW760]EDR29162.1 hypothetical protein EDI_127280 [Entamoeba dispar SAW760]|eukprot:EDR29162.1 hypothetical protein EDI_127280 [Entamoeba dispar SAW760]